MGMKMLSKRQQYYARVEDKDTKATKGLKIYKEQEPNAAHTHTHTHKHTFNYLSPASTL